MRRLFTISLVVAVSFAVGCGGSPEAEVTGGSTTTISEETPGFAAERPAKQYNDPKLAVNDFLVAVKTGDDKSATQLLSTEAQREAWTNGLAISAEGFPDAQFQISEVEYLKENTEAHVMSVWENKSNYGQQKSFQCVWLLKSEPHGWSIYGMATKFLDHLQPIVLNFENQVEMQKRQLWAQEEIRKFAELQKHQQQVQQVGTHGPADPNAQTAGLQEQAAAGQSQQFAGQRASTQQQQTSRYGEAPVGQQQAARPNQTIR